MQRVTAEELAAAQEHRRPQDPKPPFPYDVEEVAYENGEVKLAGTLTLPKEGPHAAALLISGSGAQNRDEEILGHKPFWLIADQLSRNGIAVLRVDDRGVGGSTGFTDQITMMDFASDVQAGLAFLRKHPRVDPKKVGLIGHSEGGAVAFRVAAGDPKLAFVVSLAGPGVNGGELLEEQVAAVLKASDVPATMIEVVRKQQREAIALLRKTKDPDELKAELAKVMDPTGSNNPQVEAQIAVVMSPWFRTFVNYEPAKDLAKLRMPVLALNGSLDVQVVADQNVPAIQKALRRNKKAKVQRLEGLNHLFQHAKSGSPTEYGEIEETMDPAVLELVTKFVADATR
jgi:pimeloyl-ACP methyl ester carboxylesterase